jgi:hypothetical protein
VTAAAQEKADNEYGQKNRWMPGETAFFEYQCSREHGSNDAELWYRSHQPVTVIDDSEKLYVPAPDLDTLKKRREAGQPRCYGVRFKDGFEGHARESELYVSPDFFWPEYGPPPQAEIAAARAKARLRSPNNTPAQPQAERGTR